MINDVSRVGTSQTSLVNTLPDNGLCPYNNINCDPPLSQTFANSLHGIFDGSTRSIIPSFAWRCSCSYTADLTVNGTRLDRNIFGVVFVVVKLSVIHYLTYYYSITISHSQSFVISI